MNLPTDPIDFNAPFRPDGIVRDNTADRCRELGCALLFLGDGIVRCAAQADMNALQFQAHEFDMPILKEPIVRAVNAVHPEIDSNCPQGFKNIEDGLLTAERLANCRSLGCTLVTQVGNLLFCPARALFRAQQSQSASTSPKYIAWGVTRYYPQVPELACLVPDSNKVCEVPFESTLEV